MTTPSSQDRRNGPAPEPADRRQAVHLREMLCARGDELDASLATYGSALERYQRRGEQTQASRIRALIRAAERERRSVHQLIAKLEERFLGTSRAEPRHPAGADPTPYTGPRVRPYPSPNRVIRA